MYQGRFRNAHSASGPQKQFHYRGKPAGKGGGFRGGGGRGGGGRGGRPGGGGFSQFIDVNKFINKSVITEKTVNFVPEHAFADFVIDNRLKANIITKGYVTPTPIQDKAIPHILRGADLVGIANTGTGKTAAFLVPLINKVIAAPQREKVLIVVPTRELAIQIEDEFKGFSTGLGLHAVSCVGGASIVQQMRYLAKPTQFVIGTPGRLKDLIERHKIDLSRFATVVLDEADRMLDMGFIGDVKFMLAKMPTPRHTLFFSATSSREVESLIKVFLHEPVVISIKTGETAEHIDQDIIRVPVGKNKFDVLCDLLRKPEFDKVLIFGKTKHGVERMARGLVAAGISAESIHGNKNQSQRVKALNLFKHDHVKALCATDVAARGLDISDVSHVINYDIPATYDDYIHRVGRTGRAGKKGKALTFV